MYVYLNGTKKIVFQLIMYPLVIVSTHARLCQVSVFCSIVCCGGAARMHANA